MRMSKMKSNEYGWYDYNSIGEDIKGRQVIGANPKICKYSDIEFAHIETKSKSGMGGYIRSDKGMSLDNARDIITMINQLEDDIKRYNSFGLRPDGVNPVTGHVTAYTDFSLVAERCLTKIEYLRGFL